MVVVVGGWVCTALGGWLLPALLCPHAATPASRLRGRLLPQQATKRAGLAGRPGLTEVRVPGVGWVGVI